MTIQVARQRFIWPDIWSDPDFAKLSSNGKVLYIGLFSNADDEGRIMADPAYLKSVVWPLENAKHVQIVAKTLHEVAKTMHDVCKYSAKGIPIIQLKNWHEWQAPKYPQPSKLPAPRGFRSHIVGPSDSGKYSWNRSGNDSVNVPGTFRERSSMGRDGKGYTPKPPKRGRENAKKLALLESAKKYVRDESPFKDERTITSALKSEFGLVGDEVTALLESIREDSEAA